MISTPSAKSLYFHIECVDNHGQCIFLILPVNVPRSYKCLESTHRSNASSLNKKEIKCTNDVHQLKSMATKHSKFISKICHSPCTCVDLMNAYP